MARREGVLSREDAGGPNESAVEYSRTFGTGHQVWAFVEPSVTDAPQRCGYVAILGRPNVGKSTLLNVVLRQKISITSRKPQTTRHNLLGIDTEGPCQAIYVDTPGIHAGAAREVERRMVRAAASVVRDVDLVVMLVDRDRWTGADALVLRHVQRSGAPAFATINKVDLLREKTALLPVIDRLAGLGAFEEILPISALKRDGVEAFREAVFARLPEHAHLFPPDQLTDRNERFLAGEIIREKLVRRLGDELPHRAAVTIESFEETQDLVEIRADIVVERSGQKRIVIGREGGKLKSIGSDARRDLEIMLGRKVMLHLWVRVRAGWTDDRARLDRMGHE